MQPMFIEPLSDELYRALKDSQPIAPLTERFPSLTLQDAYAIQMRVLAHRVEIDGERVIGKKIGVTGQVVMDLLKVDQPDFGHLTSAMLREDGAAIATNELIAPKAEGEIAFILKHELAGPGVTVADVLRATEYVMPCFEIVDSRIRDWKIQIQDTVADNASSCLYVLGGRPVKPDAVDLPQVGMVFYKNGEIMNTGVGAAALGDPAACVAWLANKLFEFGISLKAGEVILSGSLGAMVAVKAGDNLRMSIGGIGSAGVRFI